MSDVKFIGLDVHKTSISAAVLSDSGKLLMQSVLMTDPAALLGFIRGVSGTVQVTFEEGTHAAWLHALLKPYVAEVLVCNPRKNALLKSGNKSDRIDARKLADCAQDCCRGCTTTSRIPLDSKNWAAVIERSLTMPLE